MSAGRDTQVVSRKQTEELWVHTYSGGLRGGCLVTSVLETDPTHIGLPVLPKWALTPATPEHP